MRVGLIRSDKEFSDFEGNLAVSIERIETKSRTVWFFFGTLSQRGVVYAKETHVKRRPDLGRGVPIRLFGRLYDRFRGGKSDPDHDCRIARYAFGLVERDGCRL